MYSFVFSLSTGHLKSIISRVTCSFLAFTKSEGRTVATRFVPGGANRSCVEDFLGSRRDEIWRAGERRGLVVAWGFGLIMYVEIIGRMWCRVRCMLGRIDGLNTVLEYMHASSASSCPLPLRLRRGWGLTAGNRLWLKLYKGWGLTARERLRFNLYLSFSSPLRHAHGSRPGFYRQKR